MTQNVGREEMLRRLRRHAKMKRGDIDAKGAARSLARETDRGAIIMLGALVEDALQEVIEGAMRKLTRDEHDRLFGPDAPIGSFSAKIRMAYALKLVSRDIAKMCDLLREMRNACAHSRADLSFKDDVLKDALVCLLSVVVEPGHMPEFRVRDYCILNLTIISTYMLMAIHNGDEDAAAAHVNKLIADAVDDAHRSALPATSQKKQRGQ